MMRPDDRPPRRRSRARARFLDAAAACLALAACLLAPGRARANPVDNFGLGSRNIAMGGAVTAFVSDFGSTYYNPAGLTQVERTEFTLGYFFAEPHLKINGLRIDEDATSGIVGGVVTPPMQLGPFKLAGGAAVEIPDKRVARTLAIPYDQPTFILYGSRNQRVELLFPLAVELFPWLSVGMTISMFAESGGGPNFLLREDRPDNEGLWSEGSVSATQKGTFYPIFGTQVRPSEWLSLGLTYRTKNEARYDVPLDIRIEPLHIWDVPFVVLDESLIVMRQGVFSFFAPEQVALGVGWRPTDGWLVGLDLTYAFWSAFRQPAPEGTTVYYGGLADLIPPNPNYPLPPPDFRDIVMPAVGVEARAWSNAKIDLLVRAGYRYRPSPAPGMPGWNNFIDSNTHIPSVGLGVVVRDPVRVVRGPILLDVHGQFFLLEERDALKTNPVADAYGDLQSSGEVVNLGATVTIRF